MTANQQGNRLWFGPKRIGYGLRPQTWQGWLVTLLLVAVIGTLVAIFA
jgi:hypothetical protein